MRKKTSFLGRFRIVEDFKKLDKLLIFLILLLTGYGLFMNLSVSKSFGILGATTQIVATVLGVIVMFIAARLDYVALAGLWKIYIPAIYLLTLSLFIWGEKREGTDNINWLKIPLSATKSLSIQPSELLKIVFIVAYAFHIYSLDNKINKPENVALLLLHALVPIVLINRLGDDGTMLIFVVIVAGMLFGSGMDIKYILAFVGAAIVLLALIWFKVGPFGGLIQEYQRERIEILFPKNRGSDPLNIEWQQDQGLISLGLGGLFGIGSKSEDKFYVDEIENDFMFTYVGQVWGFVGIMALVILMFTLCVRILIIGFNSHDKLGTMICIGVFSMIAAQSIINIGMCLKIMPVIGITLPFFSKGGSSIVSILGAMGLVLSVHGHNKSTLFSLSRKNIRKL